MTTLRIAEVAERTGVPATTLRYYEGIGLQMPAGRRDNGYRAYSERDVERLRFITRAKQLDLGLDDLRELVRAWDGGDECSSVQLRMAQLIAARSAQTRQRLVELQVLEAQLRSATDRLSGAAGPGPCDDECACSTVDAVAALIPVEAVTPPRIPVACSLDGTQVRWRVDDWQAVLARATRRDPCPGGFVVTFARDHDHDHDHVHDPDHDHDPDLVAELARLAVAEQECCPFLEFTLAVTAAGVRFEVSAPAEAEDLITLVFGPHDPAR
jgi:DNA-binding transcriptional MerR regulator